MNNDRDTHFLGFARLQRLRVSEAIEKLMAENKSPVINSTELNQRVETILAQCAYDLAYYVLKTAEEHDLFADNFFGRFSLDTEAKLSEIPDLTEWPIPPV